ncbi:MAG: LysE family translocator [Salinisphaera sp.]|jgi:homoserine/homoserine lactone efflux protein|nr:LysE family translocator [Salinisphaera sp.]
MSLSTLSVFIPTFFLVSLTPGLCMTLSLSLGMTVGVRRAAWMMAGELVGVATVAVLSVVGVATILLRYPDIFTAFKVVGGAYLIWLGIEMWRSKGNLAIPEINEDEDAPPPPRGQLAGQGLITAIANPKGWAFFIALLPPFLNFDAPLAPQLTLLLSMILTMELTCLMLYATGGSAARSLLAKRSNVRVLNRIAGTLIIGVGIWLALD